jgi:hypothetical protein
MEYRTIKPKILNYREFRFRRASEDDCSELIDHDLTITFEGEEEPRCVYKTDVNTEGLLSAVSNIKLPKTTRTSGLVTTSRIFGYSPRNMIRNAPCKATSLAGESPQEHGSLVHGAEIASKVYKEHAPIQHKAHSKMTENYVLPEYRLGNSPFTSGIVNENNPLLYHFDQGNYPNVWSAMFSFKDGIEGGNLCAPVLDMKFATNNNSVILFDGQGLLHGVTPIVKRRKDAKRFTIVYYSLKNMWSCEAYKDEIEAMKASRTQTELEKARKLK